MKLYLVYQSDSANILSELGCNLMLSFAAIGLGHTIPKGFSDVMLDSGGYQLQTGVKVGRTISITAYTSWLQDAIPNHPEIKAYMNLDITGDTDATITNLLYMESEGLHPLPVWHPSDGDTILDYYAQYHDYIAIGAIAKGNKIAIRHIFERVKTRYPDHKFHLLGVGLNASAALINLRPYSIDFSTWMNSFRYGLTVVWGKDGLLHEAEMAKEDKQRLRTDRSFRRQKVREVLMQYRKYSKVLDNYDGPGIQGQMDIWI